jgi:hypothetical protein
MPKLRDEAEPSYCAVAMNTGPVTPGTQGEVYADQVDEKRRVQREKAKGKRENCLIPEGLRRV